MGLKITGRYVYLHRSEDLPSSLVSLSNGSNILNGRENRIKAEKNRSNKYGGIIRPHGKAKNRCQSSGLEKQSIAGIHQQKQEGKHKQSAEKVRIDLSLLRQLRDKSVNRYVLTVSMCNRGPDVRHINQHVLGDLKMPCQGTVKEFTSQDVQGNAHKHDNEADDDPCIAAPIDDLDDSVKHSFLLI